MKLGKKAIALIGVPIGLGIAAGLVFMFVLNKPAEAPKLPDPSPGQHGVMIALEDKVVNLMTGGDFRYAKIGVTVEVRPEKADFYALKGEARVAAEKEILKDYEAAMPLLQDAVGTAVGSRTSSELATPEGRQKLKEDLHAAVAGVLGEEEVLAVYFTDLVMQ